MTYTARFDEIRKDDIAQAGAKGANLGESSHAGLPVPPGFVVTTAAYDTFVEASDSKYEVVALASVPPASDPCAVWNIRPLYLGVWSDRYPEGARSRERRPP
jgi:phosphoenolpyruvate synthase/pyruvate phosphate dikinase